MKYNLMEPLRGIAALWVFSFHHDFSGAFQISFPHLFRLTRYGNMGVPMFFVISGYCITASARSTIRKTGSEGWKSFLYKRVRRIYPPFWFSILVTISIPFLLALISSVKSGQFTGPSPANINYGFLNYGIPDWLSLVTLARVFQYIPGIHILSDKFTTINAVYWTLAIEVQFYLVVTLVIATGWNYFRAITLITLLSLPFIFAPDGIMRSGLFLPYWPMFAVGIALYWILEKRTNFDAIFGKSHLRMGLAGTAIFVGLFLAAVLRGYKFDFLLFAILFGGFLIPFQDFDKLFGSKQTHKSAVVRYPLLAATILGEMSYSLYLLHGKLTALSDQVLRQIVTVDSVAFDIALIAFTVALCYGFHLVCEKPFLSLKPTPLDAENRFDEAVIPSPGVKG